MAQILGHMGMELKKNKTYGNQLPKSGTTKKMRPHRLIRLKGWYGLCTGIIVMVLEIWKDLEAD